MSESEVKRVVTLEADIAVSEFNFVEGHVYFNSEDNAYHIPAHTGPQHYVCDCWVISKEDWDQGVRPQTLDQNGELPVPIRASDLGSSVGWLDDLMPEATKKALPKPSARLR